MLWYECNNDVKVGVVFSFLQLSLYFLIVLGLHLFHGNLRANIWYLEQRQKDYYSTFF